MIAIKNLTFSYPDAPPCLQGIDLEIRPGEFVAIMGANGSGKTTFARCLNGLLVPQKGRILVDGLDAAADPLPVRKRLGMVFQNPDDQLVATTVEDEIAFGLENLALPRSAMLHRLEAALADFDLERYRHHPPHLLSGGEKQRLAIAAAVALHPRYLVLDEPTALLDPASRHDICRLLGRLRQQLGLGLIFISQFPTEAAQAERLILFHRGEVVADEAPAQVFNNAPLLRPIGLDLPFASAVAIHLKHILGLDLAPHISIGKLAEALAPLLPAGSPTPAVSTHPKDTTTKIAAQHLYFSYDLPGGLKTGLNGADLEVPAGAILALLGPSGSGKTTFAQHLNGLLKPNRGHLLLDGTDIWQDPAQLRQVRRRVGLVFQFPELQLFDETVEKDVGFGLRQLALAPDLAAQRIEQALALVGLPRSNYGHRPPLSLSGGERRRAALAGILAMDPDVLVLDEPTAA